MGDESGVVAPMIAVFGVSLLAAAGLALDVGLYYSGNRDLGAATEAAALAAAMDPARATERAEKYLVSNGYEASVLQSVEIGYYCANIHREAKARFVPAGSPDVVNCPGSSFENAVRLTTGRPSRQFLTGLLGPASPIPQLSATASAARIDEAGVSTTSGLLTVTNVLVQVVNELLGGLLGIKLLLEPTDIEAMLNGNVDAGRFFDALAKQAGTSGTYQDVAQGTYDIRQIAYAAAAASYSDSTARALTHFGDKMTRPYAVPMNGLFSLGVWKHMPIGGADSPTTLHAGLNAYQLISHAIQMGPANLDLSNLVSLIVPDSVVQVKAVATGNTSRPRFAFGPSGETSVGTSLLRLQVNVVLTNLKIPYIVGAKAEVPLVIDVGAAEATVSKIDCADQTEQSTQTNVTVAGTSGLVNVYLGRLARPDAMGKTVPALGKDDFAKVEILSLRLLGSDLVTVKGKAIGQPVLGKRQDVVFGPSGPGKIGTPTSAGNGVVVGNDLQLGETLTGLANNLELETCITPLICLRSDQGVLELVRGVVYTVGVVLGGSIDPLLSYILAVLGVQLGHATVWVNGARCGVPVLI